MGRYYLDLTKKTEILGISSELYNNDLHNIEQMNNKNKLQPMRVTNRIGVAIIIIMTA